jgi:hypothetical protein
MKGLDVPKETLERMSFEEKYEGYVLDIVKHLSEEVSIFFLKPKSSYISDYAKNFHPLSFKAEVQV